MSFVIAERQRAWIAEGKEHVVLRVRNIENFKIYGEVQV